VVHVAEERGVLWLLLLLKPVRVELVELLLGRRVLGVEDALHVLEGGGAARRCLARRVEELPTVGQRRAVRVFVVHAALLDVAATVDTTALVVLLLLMMLLKLLLLLKTEPVVVVVAAKSAVVGR
jgi:hypothetical protein